MEIWIFLLIILIFSAIFHEYAHGFAAYALGDPTAKNAGRLTFNPIPHIDPFMTIMLPLVLVLVGSPFIIGGAKPVPINPFNLRQKYDALKVALAGPFSNILLALLFGLMIRFLPFVRETESLFLAFGAVVFLNLLLAFFNLLPIPPLDGSHVLFTFFPSIAGKVKMFFAQYGFIVLFLVLILFFSFIFQFLFIVISLVFFLFTGSYLGDLFMVMGM